MISEEEGAFYTRLRKDIEQNPQWVLSAMQAIQSGITNRLKQEQDDRADWETIAAAAMEARMFKNNKGWLAHKIERLEARAFFRWSHIIEGLKK
jgi:hypothetical protein